MLFPHQFSSQRSSRSSQERRCCLRLPLCSGKTRRSLTFSLLLIHTSSLYFTIVLSFRMERSSWHPGICQTKTENINYYYCTWIIINITLQSPTWMNLIHNKRRKEKFFLCTRVCRAVRMWCRNVTAQSSNTTRLFVWPLFRCTSSPSAPNRRRKSLWNTSSECER